MEVDSSFQLDTLIKSVQDLQQQRSNLEKNLQTLRLRKRSLEDRLDTISARHGQVRDINTKMTETLKVAQHKVAQTHGQMTLLEATYRENKEFVKEMNEKIEEERKSQLNETFDFEKKLGEIAKRLKEARDFYSPQNLEDEITKMGTRTDQLLQETTTTDNETTRLQLQLQDMNDKAPSEQPEVAAGDQRAALDVFEGELQVVTSVGDSCNQRWADLMQKLSQVSQQ